MLKSWLNVLQTRWNSYKYRFVPWIAVNICKNERTLRQVPLCSLDKLVSDEEVLRSITKLFRALFSSNLGGQRDLLRMLSSSSQTNYQAAVGEEGPSDPGRVMFDTMGFAIERRPSSLQSAGTGTVYQKYEPIFFQSICNPFIFRCIDGVLIDGNDKGISKAVYRSCSGRDRLGPVKFSDTTWLTDEPYNPLAVGQYVNNCSNDKAANVCYQEFDVPTGFPIELCQYLPNVNYRMDMPSESEREIHPSSAAYLRRGREDACLSSDAQTSLSPEDSSREIPRCSQAI
ncbi:SET domain-containing protein 9 isoform X4 [Brienomyrus brachyistius]|uniref:SET domain-containing protein 9 isoform X4 n=1 Tax=Brienomyrus brachyistius TaxID=42636 RepID=UPI0020B1F8DA|nr:SET domain-containing protein 9 isoform X4 [Brienomyrus brachyistius]